MKWIISRSISQLGLMFRWLVDDVSGQAINVLKASDALSTGNNDLSQLNRPDRIECATYRSHDASNGDYGKK